MFIVDSQVHIWKEETPDRPWVPGARERIRRRSLAAASRWFRTDANASGA